MTNKFSALLSTILTFGIFEVSAQEGRFEVRVVDQTTREPLAARMHLKDSKGKPVIPPKSVNWRDHFVFQGSIDLRLKPGRYTFQLERGPEYRVVSGHFKIERNSNDAQVIELYRFVDMKKEGWWSGDLHVHRPLADIELLMEAEDLHVAPVITWWNKRNWWQSNAIPAELLKVFSANRMYQLMAGEDEREGGALLFFQLPRPLEISNASREFPSPVQFIREARQNSNVHIDVEKPFWWDMPVWVATREIDSMGIAHNHMHREGVLDNEAWGKARDKLLFPSPLGNGRWTHEIYFHLLNCGLRIPPSAGSASGVLPNPVGYNRVYVHCGPDLSYEKWWDGLKAGEVVVTNGPLIRPRFNDQLPGHVFHVPAGERFTIKPTLDFSIRDKVSYLEIIKNGETVHEIRLEDFIGKQGELPEIPFTESGWMLIRTVTEQPDTFRFAMTGPVYVEVDAAKRVSRKSAQFFTDWVSERIRRINLSDPKEQQDVVQHHFHAREFWSKLLSESNAK